MILVAAGVRLGVWLLGFLTSVVVPSYDSSADLSAFTRFGSELEKLQLLCCSAPAVAQAMLMLSSIRYLACSGTGTVRSPLSECARTQKLLRHALSARRRVWLRVGEGARLLPWAAACNARTGCRARRRYAARSQHLRAHDASFPAHWTLVEIGVVSFSMCLRSHLLLAGFLLTNACFVLAASLLHKLSLAVLADARLARVSTLLFCLPPANVFMGAVYTESPFAACSFLGMLLLVRRSHWFVLRSAPSTTHLELFRYAGWRRLRLRWRRVCARTAQSTCCSSLSTH